MLCVVATLLAAPDARGQDADTCYRYGMIAADQKDWAAVERWMAQAIALTPTSNRKRKVRVLSMRFEMYLPSYYLGLARYKLGNCVGALDAWDDAARFAQLRGLRAKQLRDLAAQCRRRTGRRPSVTRPQPRTPTRHVGPRHTPPTKPARPKPRPVWPDPTPSPPQPRPKPLWPDSVPTPPPSAPSLPPTPPPKQVAGTSAEVRKQVLQEKAAETLTCLDAGERWMRTLDRAKSKRWRAKKAVANRYANAQRSLRAARFRLGQGQSENDIDAVTSAEAEACAARDVLADIGRTAGVDPPD